MKKVSVTTIEKFRRALIEESPFDTEAAVIAAIDGTFTGTDKTRFGGAYHQIIEGDCIVQNTGVLAGGYIFTNEQARPAIEYIGENPGMVHEIPLSEIYETRYGPIKVSGRVDTIQGLWVRDAKTKFRPPSTTEYMDSCQWKFYLDFLQAELFYYDLFEVKDYDDLCPALLPGQTFHINPAVSIHRHESIPCLTYQGLKDDLSELLEKFMLWAIDTGNYNLLKDAEYKTVTA